MSKYTKRLELVAIDKLIPYANNARTHSDDQIKKIQASLREFGFVNPVLIDKDCGIIAGHGRVEAAKREGIVEVPCVWVEHLTEAQKKAYILADNRLAEMAGWDEEMLRIELEELRDLDFDVALTGFIESDSDVGTATRPTVEEDDFIGEIPDEPKTNRGDIFALGKHRLLCGDSTLLVDWERLMSGGEAVLVLTDPPYNMGYEGAGGTPKAKRKANKIVNDNLSDEDFSDFLLRSYENICAHLVEGGSFYIFYKENGTGVFIKNLAAAGLLFKQELIWVKNQLVLGGAKYQNIYEPFLFGCKGDSVKRWYANRRERSVIESTQYMSEAELIEAIRELQGALECDIVREKKNAVNDLHPTMKPLRLLGRLIGNSSLPGDIVVDCFGGSGSTMMACEQLKRRCYMIEYEPKYCDVIIDRWETLTGEKAELLDK